MRKSIDEHSGGGWYLIQNYENKIKIHLSNFLSPCRLKLISCSRILLAGTAQWALHCQSSQGPAAEGPSMMRLNMVITDRELSFCSHKPKGTKTVSTFSHW